ncbi:MAG: hypothetical protein MUF45_12900 [Spirosomaceae bacterium]|nr:hypothetical protein [Spirosomataceae bacterium]
MPYFYYFEFRRNDTLGYICRSYGTLFLVEFRLSTERRPPIFSPDGAFNSQNSG